MNLSCITIVVELSANDNQKALTRVDGDKFNNLYVSRENFDTKPINLCTVGSSTFTEMEVSDKRLPEYENQQRWGRAGTPLTSSRRRSWICL